MITRVESSRLFRALSVLLVILLLAYLAALMLLLAEEFETHFQLLRGIAAQISAEADAPRVQVVVLVSMLLSFAALAVAVILISILLHDVRPRDHQQAGEVKGRQVSQWNPLLEQASEQIHSAASTGRKISQRLLDGSRFEAAHLLAAGSQISKIATLMDEMTQQAEHSEAVATESMEPVAESLSEETDAANEADVTMQQKEEALYYLADLSRRIAQVSQQQSGSVAGVGKSIESLSEISRRSADDAATLSECAADLDAVCGELQQ